MSDGIRIDFSITGCSFDFSYILMWQAVARHIAQLLENHWTGNNSPTLVSGTTFSHKYKAALFYQFFFFFDKTGSCAYIRSQWASMFNWQKLRCVYHYIIILLLFRAGIEVEKYAFDYLIIFPGRVLRLMSGSINIRPIEEISLNLKSKEKNLNFPCHIKFVSDFKAIRKVCQPFLWRKKWLFSSKGGGRVNPHIKFCQHVI